MDATMAKDMQPPLNITGRGRQTAELLCPKLMVGRVIGKNGETIKALQIFTGALIQIDQSVEPARVTVSGNTQSLSLALSMISDVCKGTFKGFALLRQMTQQQRGPGAPPPSMLQSRPVYAPGYGLIPPSQLYGGDVQPGMPMLPRPDAVQLPAGFQYVSSAASPQPQVILGLPSMAGRGMPDHSAMLNQQMAVPQVYGAMPLSNPVQHGTPLAYYQPSDMQPHTPLGPLGREPQRQQQQRRQQLMFQPIEQGRPSGISMQPMASLPLPQASLYPDQENSRQCMGRAASLYAQKQQGTASMPLPSINVTQPSMYQSQPSSSSLGRPLDVGRGGVYQHASDSAYAMQSNTEAMYQRKEQDSNSTPLPPHIGKAGGSSSAKLMQAVLGQQHGGVEGSSAHGSEQRQSLSGAVVEELLGRSSAGGNAGDPGPSSAAPLGLPSSSGGHLVQIVDAEGQVGYYYNE